MSVRAQAISGSSQLLFSTRRAYFGHALAETAGASAKVRIRDGSVTGTIVDDITFSAGESSREWYGPNAIACESGIYVEIVSGTVEGSVRWS